MLRCAVLNCPALFCVACWLLPVTAVLRWLPHGACHHRHCDAGAGWGADPCCAWCAAVAEQGKPEGATLLP